MASGSDVKVTVTIEPEDARKLAAEVFELRERLKEAEDRAASWEALDAEAQIGADEVSRQLRDLKAELADVRAQWASDVGSAIARAQTAEARARAMELERDAARAEAARLRSALITYADAREMVLKALPASIVNETEELWGVTNTQLVRRALSYLWHCAALRGPAQSEKRE